MAFSFDAASVQGAVVKLLESVVAAVTLLTV